MSRWTTVSVETPDGDHYYQTEFGAWGQEQMDQPLPETVDTTQLSTACIIACNDTPDTATIAYSKWDDTISVKPHDGSLWTCDIQFGSTPDWHENVYQELPYWCKVRGNWNHIDR
jgi:hypothetical protein